MTDLPNPSHAERVKQRKMETCFGLAEEMLSQLEKGQFERRPSQKVYPDRKIEKELIVNGISIPEDQRGVDKILAASALALYAINEERKELGPDLNAGFEKFGTDVKCWIEDFDTKKINFKAAHQTMEKLKDLLKEAKDPSVGYPEIPKRAEGAYWIGPFNDEMASGIMNMLVSFHGEKFPHSRELDMNDGKGTYYVDCDRQQMTGILQKEGLLAKGRAAS